MLYAHTIGADPPPGALTFAAIVNAVSGACAADRGRLSGLAMNFLAAAVSYYRIREASVGDVKASTYDPALAGAYHTLAITANDIAQRAGARTATCAQILAEVTRLLERHRDDPRDQTYVEMNVEIRDFHDKAMAMASGYSPMPQATARKLAGVGLLGLTLAIGLAASVAIVRNR